MLKKIWFHSFIDSFKFLCMSDKPRLYQLNIITSSRSTTVQASLTARIFSYVPGNTVKEGEIPYVEKKYKTSPTYQIKHAKISYSIVSLVFRKFSYRRKNLRSKWIWQLNLKPTEEYFFSIKMNTYFHKQNYNDDKTKKTKKIKLNITT